MMPRPACPVLVALACIAGLTSPASAFDCAKAATPTEKAICANVALKLADDRMAKAYAALSATLGQDAKAELLAAQRAWLKRREECVGPDHAGQATCLLERTTEHALYLEGGIAPGAALGPAPKLVPLMAQQTGDKRHYDVDYRLLAFAAPADPGEKAFNAEMETMLSEAPLDPIAADEEMFGQYASSLEAEITLINSRIIAARISGYSYEGGAHGMAWTSALNIDRASGRALGFSALFDAEAGKALAELCKEQIAEAKRERLDDYNWTPESDGNYSDDYLKDGLEEFGQWVLSPARAVVTFNQYAVGSYAEGQYECEFDAVLLEGLSKGRLVLQR